MKNITKFPQDITKLPQIDIDDEEAIREVQTMISFLRKDLQEMLNTLCLVTSDGYLTKEDSESADFLNRMFWWMLNFENKENLDILLTWAKETRKEIDAKTLDWDEARKDLVEMLHKMTGLKKEYFLD